MRLLVVRGSAPLSSFSTPRWRRIAAQPPGPGLPLQAPSVKISTKLASGSLASGPLRSAIEAVIAGADDAAVKAQSAQKFEWVLGPHQRALRLVQPVVEPGQQEAQRAAASQRRQRREF